MGDRDESAVIDDSRMLTRSELEWLRQVRQVITPDTVEWLSETRQVLTKDMLISVKKQSERNQALGVFLFVAGGLMAALGIDRVVKIGKAVLGALGDTK